MKKKAATTSTASPSESRPANAYWLDYFFPLLPLVALIPNFFILPSLNYSGLATQEVGFAAAVLVCALIGLIQTRAAGHTFSFSRPTVLIFASLGLLILWQTLSLLWSVERGEAWRQIGLWFGFLVFLSALWNGLRARAAWWGFYTLLIFAAVLALSLWLEYRTYGVEMYGTFFNHGLTAELLATLFPLFFCVFLFEKNRRPAFVGGALATVFTLLALSITLRRAPLLGAGVAFVLIMAALLTGQMKAAYRWRVIVVVMALLLFGLPLVIVKREAILTRLRGATELQTAVNSEDVELGLTSRATKWLIAWEMGKAHLFKGVGMSNYPVRYAAYRRNFIENPRYAAVVAAAETEDSDQVRSPLAHSEYLQLFAELGLVGVVLYALFWLQVLWLLWRARHKRRGYLAFGAFCSLVAFGVSAALSAFAFRLTPGIITVACVLALACAALSDEPPNTDDENKRAAAFTLPRNAVLGLWFFAAAVSALLLARNYQVYDSQRLQGSSRMETQLDFSFALDNAAANEASVRRYERVLASDPDNAGAHLGYAVLLFQMKRLPECLPHADYAFQHGYNRPFTYLLRAFAHEHGTSADKAQEVLREGIASFPKSVILRMAYAELLRKRSHPEEVQIQQAELEKQKLDPNFVKSWALALRYKDEEATRLAKANGLTPPGELKPTLARVLAQARAFHYFRNAAPTATPTLAP